jgi:hypothetical protein
MFISNYFEDFFFSVGMHYIFKSESLISIYVLNAHLSWDLHSNLTISKCSREKKRPDTKFILAKKENAALIDSPRISNCIDVDSIRHNMYSITVSYVSFN